MVPLLTIAPLQAGKTYTYDGGSFEAERSYAYLPDSQIDIIPEFILKPEPTTIALLGLGCMMLVKRKRA